MENCNLSLLLRGGRFTTLVVEKSPPPNECIPFKISLGIIEKVMNDHYAGDGIVHPSVHENRNYVYNFYPHDGESKAQAWGRLKTLMLKCPNHGLPKDMIFTKFYARLSRHDKELLDASSMGSFTNEKIDDKWELLERIQRNIEDWEIDKGKESGINYEYFALSPLFKLQVLISLVLSLVLILNSLLISSKILLRILICLRRIGPAS